MASVHRALVCHRCWLYWFLSLWCVCVGHYYSVSQGFFPSMLQIYSTFFLGGGRWEPIYHKLFFQQAEIIVQIFAHVLPATVGKSLGVKKCLLTKKTPKHTTQKHKQAQGFFSPALPSFLLAWQWKCSQFHKCGVDLWGSTARRRFNTPTSWLVVEESTSCLSCARFLNRDSIPPMENHRVTMCLQWIEVS